jgi:hypothetical protein
MVFTVACIKAMPLAIAQSPEIIQEITKVAEDPVIRQLTVLAKLRHDLSLKAHFPTDLCSRDLCDRFIKGLFAGSITHPTTPSNMHDIRHYLYLILTLVDRIEITTDV